MGFRVDIASDHGRRRSRSGVNIFIGHYRERTACRTTILETRVIAGRMLLQLSNRRKVNASRRLSKAYSDSHVFPDSKRIVHVFGRQREIVISRVVLPFFGLSWVVDSKAQSPGYTLDGVGQEIWWSERVFFELCALDFGIDGHEISRLATNGAAVLLFDVVPAAHNNRLGSIQLCHRDAE